jgi:hypothetical protein
MVRSTCPQNKRQVVGGARAGRGGVGRVSRKQNHQLCGAGTGVLDAKRLGVNVRPERERENRFGGVVVLAFDVDLSFGCWLSDVPPFSLGGST